MVPDRKRIRVITNRVDFITTAKAIRAGIGMNTAFNAAILKTMSDLDNMYGSKNSIRGLVQTVGDYSIQLSVL